MVRNTIGPASYNLIIHWCKLHMCTHLAWTCIEIVLDSDFMRSVLSKVFLVLADYKSGLGRLARDVSFKAQLIVVRAAIFIIFASAVCT